MSDIDIEPDGPSGLRLFRLGEMTKTNSHPDSEYTAFR